MIMNQAPMTSPSSRATVLSVGLRYASACALLLMLSLPALGRDMQGMNGLAVHDVRIYLAAATQPSARHAAVRRPSKSFDHLLTGFPLFGAHARVPCGTCHTNGVLKGTPTQCVQCHGGPGMRAATYKPYNHVPTQLPCDQCHNQMLWSGARFDHTAVAPGSCLQCHNGSTAPGKPSGHPVTSEPCDACHGTTSWLPAKFNHAGVAPGTCLTCHGVTAPGLPSGHFVETVNRSCDACHTTSAWLPLIDYLHTSPYYPGRHKSSVTCNDCHNNTEIIAWPNAADKAFCGGCHKSNYTPDPHTKYGNVKYTYDELKDCTGSCHVYTDSTLTTISQSRSGHHHPSDSSWGD
jgi:hypothetical protein